MEKVIHLKLEDDAVDASQAVRMPRQRGVEMKMGVAKGWRACLCRRRAGFDGAKALVDEELCSSYNLGVTGYS